MPRVKGRNVNTGPGTRALRTRRHKPIGWSHVIDAEAESHTIPE